MSRKPTNDATSYKVHEVKALKKMPLPDLARDLLERLVHATHLLMQRQQFRVVQLVEFYPQNASLLGLNVNRGYRIMIRLRSAHNRNSFLPWESLLGTMVHELVHNSIGEHSFDFYQLVDKLSEEVQVDMMKLRISGVNPYEVKAPAAPFDWSQSKGHKLGGNTGSSSSTTSRTASSGCGSIADYLKSNNSDSNLDTITNKSTPVNGQSEKTVTKKRATIANNNTNNTNNTHNNTLTKVHTASDNSSNSKEYIRQQRLLALAKNGVSEALITYTNTNTNTINNENKSNSTYSRRSSSSNNKTKSVLSSTSIYNNENSSSNNTNSNNSSSSSRKRSRSEVVILDEDDSDSANDNRNILTAVKKEEYGERDNAIIDLSGSPIVKNDSSKKSISNNKNNNNNINRYSYNSSTHNNVDDTVIKEEEEVLLWCEPCAPLVIDLVALGLDEDEDDEEDTTNISNRSSNYRNHEELVCIEEEDDDDC